MSQIDVMTHWKSPQSDHAMPVRLRIIQEDGKTLALLSPPSQGNPKDDEILNEQLDREYQHAATSVSILFCLKPLETIWLREVVHEGKPHVCRVIMDERNGAMVNARSGTMTPWETAVTKNIDRYFSKSRRFRNFSWAGVLVIGLSLGVILLLVNQNREMEKRAKLTEEIKKSQHALEEMSQKVLMIDLIEKERQNATVAHPNLKRVYRQTTNVMELPKIPLRALEQMTNTIGNRNWVENWNERIFPQTTNRLDVGKEK